MEDEPKTNPAAPTVAAPCPYCGRSPVSPPDFQSGQNWAGTEHYPEPIPKYVREQGF